MLSGTNVTSVSLEHLKKADSPMISTDDGMSIRESDSHSTNQSISRTQLQWSNSTSRKDEQKIKPRTISTDAEKETDSRILQDLKASFRISRTFESGAKVIRLTDVFLEYSEEMNFIETGMRNMPDSLIRSCIPAFPKSSRRSALLCSDHFRFTIRTNIAFNEEN
jgi:hypothetical protein